MDRRTKYTKNIIKETFIDLLSEKDISKVSVSEICKIADINRATFYRYYFKSAEFIGHLAIAVIGIRDGKQISYEDFCFVKIPYPNIKEQKAISTVLLQADKEIEIQKQKLAALQEQKKGLMQVLLTGKNRIK